MVTGGGWPAGTQARHALLVRTPRAGPGLPTADPGPPGRPGLGQGLTLAVRAAGLVPVPRCVDQAESPLFHVIKIHHHDRGLIGRGPSRLAGSGGTGDSEPGPARTIAALRLPGAAGLVPCQIVRLSLGPRGGFRVRVTISSSLVPGPVGPGGFGPAAATRTAEHSMRTTVGYGGPARGHARKL